jgi:putative endonuclease
LTNQGLRLVTRNFHHRGGEVDLVMLHDDSLVFVEVRYRKSAGFAAPAVTVDYRKQQKLVRTAAMFLARHAHYANYTVRFDVVAIVGGDAGGNSAQARWIKDAFRPGNSSL